MFVAAATAPAPLLKAAQGAWYLEVQRIGQQALKRRSGKHELPDVEDVLSSVSWKFFSDAPRILDRIRQNAEEQSSIALGPFSGADAGDDAWTAADKIVHNYVKTAVINRWSTLLRKRSSRLAEKDPGESAPAAPPAPEADAAPGPNNAKSKSKRQTNDDDAGAPASAERYRARETQPADHDDPADPQGEARMGMGLAEDDLAKMLTLMVDKAVQDSSPSVAMAFRERVAQLGAIARGEVTMADALMESSLVRDSPEWRGARGTLLRSHSRVRFKLSEALQALKGSSGITEEDLQVGELALLTLQQHKRSAKVVADVRSE